MTIVHGTVLLVFGFTLAAAFSGIRFTEENVLIFLSLFVFSGGLQLVAMYTASEEMVWKLYPPITHLPLIMLLCLVYRKHLVAAASAVFTAYLCCQPAKWVGVFTYQISGSTSAELVMRTLCLLLTGYVTIVYLSPFLSEIFSKDTRSVCIFGIVPTVYYLFDYATAIYTDLWMRNIRVVMEFPALFLAAIFMIFCVVYYKEYEQKAEAQHKEQVIQIAVEQQAKEIAAIKQATKEIRLLRHDMRMFLSSLAIAIENGDMETVNIMINSQVSQIDGTKLVRFCSNDIINYVISDYAARCKDKDVEFTCNIKMEELTVDELLFSSILSNALDNALDAQKTVPPEKRSIRLMLKNSNGKLLLSVKNAVGKQVLFADDLPVSIPDRHGHGTQSILYLTEKLGGNCQFSAQDDDSFLLRVVL